VFMPVIALCGKCLNMSAYGAAGAVSIKSGMKGVVELRLFRPSA